MVFGIIGNLVGFVLGLVVGGLALFVAGEFVHGGGRDLKYGLVTALIGVVVWAVLSWVPLIGVLLALIGWIGVIKWRYGGDWGTAAVHGVVAWVLALAILWLLGLVGLGGLSAFGVPFA